MPNKISFPIASLTDRALKFYRRLQHKGPFLCALLELAARDSELTDRALSMTVPPDRSAVGRPTGIADDALLALKAEGLSNAAIGREAGMTRSAVGDRFRKINQKFKEKQECDCRSEQK